MKSGEVKISTDFAETFQSVPDEIAGKLIKAVFQYHMNGDLPEDYMTSIIFIQLKNALDKQHQKYVSVCIRNKKNIEERWNNKTIPNDSKNTIGIITNDLEDENYQRRLSSMIKRKEQFRKDIGAHYKKNPDDKDVLQGFFEEWSSLVGDGSFMKMDKIKGFNIENYIKLWKKTTN